jgi:hypothetical protein
MTNNGHDNQTKTDNTTGKEQLMKTLQQQLLLGLATLALLVAGLGLSAGNSVMMRKVNEYEGQHRVVKVNEYEGQHRVAKVNEYEGQHRVAGDPSQWG